MNEFKWLTGPFPFPKFRFDLIASLTYLIPNSQDLIKSFPHDKYVAIAEDNVQPVPLSIFCNVFFAHKYFNNFFI